MSSPVFSFDVNALTVLPKKLYLANVDLEAIEALCQSLIRLGFFSPSGTFFSFTEVEDEISILVEEDSWSLFTQKDLTLFPECWRAIQIFEGEEAIDEVGYVSSLTAPLDKEGINVLYLSTFRTDLLLVRETDLEKAFNILKQLIQQSRRPPIESVTKSRSVLLSKLPYSLKLASFSREALPQFTHYLLNLMLFPSKRPRFLSYTLSPTGSRDEVSLIIDEESLALLSSGSPESLFINKERWFAIQVSGGSTGFTSGLVSDISNTLAHHQISLYYLSTYQSDFTLVTSAQVDLTVASLQSSFDCKLFIENTEDTSDQIITL